VISLAGGVRPNHAPGFCGYVLDGGSGTLPVTWRNDALAPSTVLGPAGDTPRLMPGPRHSGEMKQVRLKWSARTVQVPIVFADVGSYSVSLFRPTSTV